MTVARPLPCRLFPLLLLLALPVGAAEEPAASRKGSITASADVTLVEVPVYVAGKDGKPVRGLTKKDFRLFDDGKLAEAWDLDVIDLEEIAHQAAPANVPLPPAAQRHFFFLFDLSFSRPVDLARARKAAIEFVRSGMRTGDLGSVATVDVEKGLKLVLSFTPDRDQLAAAISTLGLPSLTSPTADPLALTVFNPTTLLGPAYAGVSPQGRAGTDAEIAEMIAAFKQMQEKVHDTYVQGRIRSFARSLGDLARTLNSVHGRTNVILFSEGFDTKLLSGVTGSESGREMGDLLAFGELWRVESEDRYGRNEVRTNLEQMFDVFRKTDCVLHAVDVSGLRTLSPGVEAESENDEVPAARLGSHGRGRNSLYLMSSETGGRLFDNSNDVLDQLGKLQQETSLIYLITYTPAPLKEPGRYHTLKVKVDAPGANPSARAGYFEPRAWAQMTPMERRLLAAQQVAYGLPRSDIPARVLATPILAASRTYATVPVIVEIPGERLVKTAASPRLDLELYVYAMDQSLKVKDLLTQNLVLDLSRVGPQLTASGIKFYGDLHLPPGTFWLKVLVRNAETGQNGLVIVPITVPPKETGPLFALAPLFHETPGKWLMVKAAPRTAGPPPEPYPFVTQGESFIPAADPVLEPGAPTNLTLFVYNSGAQAELDVRGEVRNKSGVRVSDADIIPVSATHSATAGPDKLLGRFRPGELAEGGYALWVRVRDRVSGARAETQGFFRVR